MRLVCVYAVAAALLIAFLRPRVAEAWAARKEKHAAARESDAALIETHDNPTGGEMSQSNALGLPR